MSPCHQIQTSAIKLEPLVLYADTEQTGEAASEYQAVQNELEALADTLELPKSSRLSSNWTDSIE